MGEENEAELLYFYGRDCGVCKIIAPLLDRLEREFGIKVERLEVWNEPNNRALMLKYGEGKCISVPFLYNRETGDYICGEADYVRVKKWAGVE